LADSTKEGVMRAVNTFMTYLVEHRVIEANPMEGVRIRRCRGRPIPHVMAEPEVAALLAAPNTSDLLGLRDRAMLELLYSSGLRRAELATLQLDDLRVEGGVLIVKHGKGGKERIVPIGRVATYWLQRYLTEARPELTLEEAPCDYVFLTSFGDRWSVGSLGQVVRKYLDQIGLKMTGSCHLLRHACATHMINHGSDLVTIKTILGHARIDTTEIYTHVSTDRVLEVHQGSHPRG